MRDMGIYTIYPKPNLSKRYHRQYIRPYLLRKVAIIRPDQVWGIDITYIRMPSLKRALTFRKPEIINSNQNGHFTNPEYILLLEESVVKISMDGKGQCLDRTLLSNS